MTDRPQPGLAQPTSVAPGVAEYQRLRAAGFSDSETQQWASRRTADLEAAGFKPSEIADYWGNGDPRSAALASHVANNVNVYSIDNPAIARNPSDAFAAGWDLSVSGLAINRRAPATVLPENAGLLDKVAHGAGLFLGDLPTTIAGFVAGGAAGGGGGLAGGPAAEVTVPIGAVAGAGLGAAALPEGTRQVLLDSYAARDGKIKTWSDAVQVATHSLIETGKQGVIGLVTAPLGGKVGATAARAGFSPVAAAGADAASQAVTATALGGAMNGHVPDAKDFEAGAILALGFHTAGASVSAVSRLRVQKNLETLYRETGTTPWDAVNRAKEDPAFRSELTEQDVNGDPVAPHFRSAASPDPEPYSRGRVIDGEEVERLRTQKPAEKPAEKPETKALPGTGALYTKDVGTSMSILRTLEGSADDAVSPAGAIGRYQIMPGTARQYMGRDFDVKSLFDPAVNERVASAIVSDLFKRYQGNMNAIAIAYNAGPGRAGAYLKEGPGTRLRAIPDKRFKGGVRYESESAPRNEASLPLETQKYLANMRRRFEGQLPERETSSEQRTYPSYELTVREGEGGGGEPPAGGEGPPLLGGPGEPKPGFWERASEEALTEEILSNIGEQPNPNGKIIDPDKILSQFVSELTPARRIDDRLISAGEMNRARDLGAEDMFRQTYASDTRAGVFVRYGAIDPITLDIKAGSKSVKDAAEAVKQDGGNLDGWIAYMLAKRTVEKEDQGVKTGFNPRAARSLAENKKAQKKYQRATDIFQGVMTSALEYSRDSGVHSQAQIDAMIRDNPTYISMRRVMGDDASFERSGRGFRPRDSLKRMEGSNREIIDPVMATLDNIRLLIKMADRNRAIGHIVGMVERGEIDKGLIFRIEDQQTIKAADEKVFKPYGLPPEAADTYASFLAQRKDAWGKTSPNDFLFFRNGKAERWTTKDPLLAELIQRADSPGQANIVMSTFQTFAKVQRAGIVSAPDFPVRNTLRDQITAFVADPLHPPPFVTWLRGIGHVIRQDEVFQDAIAKGALGSALVDMDVNWLARDMDAIFAETGTWERVANTVKHPLEFAQIIQERIDAASRVGYYIHAKEAKGIQPIKAATMSRKAYLDFAERGTAGIADGMAKITPFFRPSLLGLKQFGEALRERPASTLAYAAVSVAVPMAALYAVNWLQDQMLPDGEKYADLPRWQRDNYFITPSIAGVRFRLRLPQEVGFVFGGMVNRLLDAAAGDKHAFEQWAKGFLDDYLGPVMPALVETPLEVLTNYNFFTGRSLVPASLEGNSGWMQYTPATTETGKALSRFLGEPGLNVMEFSPIQFDHFVQGWTGTVGATLLKTVDAPFKQNNKPWEVADIPFVGSFVARHPAMSAQPIQDFYAGMHELEKHNADFNLAMQRAEGGQGAGEIELTAEASQYATAVQPIKAAIQVQTAAVQGIVNNPELTVDEKRQAIDALYPMLVQTAKRGLEVIDSLPKKGQKEEPAEALPTPPPVQQTAGSQTPATQPLPGANRGLVPVS